MSSTIVIAWSRARPLHVCRCRKGRAVSKAVISRAWTWLGLVDVAQEVGVAVVDMTPTEDMANSAGFVHGGMISALADSAMGRSLRTIKPGVTRSMSFDLKLSFIT